MNKDDIKEKIHEFFENCESPVMPFHVAKEIGLDEEFTKSMLDEFVCSGELQQDGGLYGRRMEASTEHAAEETVH